LLAVPDLPDPRALPAWAEAATPTTESLPLLHMAQQLIYPYRPLDRLVLPARAMEALLAVLLGTVVCRWARDLWGWGGGLLALFLLAFDPNILAHASVAGTDLGAACFITLALFSLHRFLRRYTVPRLLLAGVTLGLALGSKTAAVLLLPVVLLLCSLALPRRRLPSTAWLLVIAVLTLWGLYGFEIGRAPGIPFPVPAPSHAIPWLRLREHMAGGHAAFLMGENRTHGWWYYFPVAFALKTPLPTLLLLGAALVQATWPACTSAVRNTPHTIRRWGPLIVFPLVYGAVSLLSPLNIGYRHLLPILPPLCVLAGQSGAPRNTHYAVCVPYFVLCIVCLSWLVLGTLSVSPHYLAYFNELAGGPDGGWRYLADSNTDWGQGYKELARFQRERGLGPVRLSAFIFYDPALYGVQYEPLTPMRGDTPAIFPARFNPPPGDYVISATTLDGIPLADPEMYDWFRKRAPDARIAHVLFYYHVPPQDPAPGWLAQCTRPTAPLQPQAIAEGFGRNDLRLAYFDCTQAWLYPDGGQSPGWYALFRGSETETPFIRAHTSLARLAYEQRRSGSLPPFRLYEWQPTHVAQAMGGAHGGPVVVAPAEWTPAQAWAEGTVVTAPVSLSGPLRFGGYRLERGQGDALEWWTYWVVTDVPSRPLSLMAHLVDLAGHAVAVGDGLGVPIEYWRVGDLIVQRHSLTLPPGLPAGRYALCTGAYWLDTMERWVIVQDGRLAGDRIGVALVSLP
ncbi:MAG: glycosyltransferase family 39 protein, partial [Anaerolineae bacterium]|nr:glycosyltransferase family 39 protein [Anaerolineae bacterium]